MTYRTGTWRGRRRARDTLLAGGVARLRPGREVDARWRGRGRTWSRCCARLSPAGTCRLEGRYKAILKMGIQTPMAQGRTTKIISMIKWIRTSRLSKRTLSLLSSRPLPRTLLLSPTSIQQADGTHTHPFRRTPLRLHLRSGLLGLQLPDGAHARPPQASFCASEAGWAGSGALTWRGGRAGALVGWLVGWLAGLLVSW